MCPLVQVPLSEFDPVCEALQAPKVQTFIPQKSLFHSPHVLGRTSTYSEESGASGGRPRKGQTQHDSKTKTGRSNMWRTLIVRLFFGCLPPLWLAWSGRISGMDQHGRLPLDGVAQVYGQALVLPFIVTDEIVQSLKKHLIQTSRCLKRRRQHSVNNISKEDEKRN